MRDGMSAAMGPLVMRQSYGGPFVVRPFVTCDPFMGPFVVRGPFVGGLFVMREPCVTTMRVRGRGAGKTRRQREGHGAGHRGGCEETTMCLGLLMFQYRVLS